MTHRFITPYTTKSVVIKASCLRSWLLVIFIALLCSTITAQASISQLFGSDNASSGSSDFLPVEEAFIFNGRVEGDQAFIDIAVTEGHYLYKHQFSFTPGIGIESLGKPDYPRGEDIYDPYYQKDLETYPADLIVQIPINYSGLVPEITIKFQGCAEAGLCYPPKKITIPLTVKAGTSSNSLEGSVTPDAYPSRADEPFYKNPLEHGLLLSLVLFILAGIGLSFTPCVLPMFPILSSLILGENVRNKGQILSLTMAYILSMSLTFAMAGTLTGLFGASLNLQAQLQSPWLLYPMAALFVVLALSMFGLYELQLPESFRSKFSGPNSQGGSISGAITMGVFSALVVSPCVSAPLAGVLVYISTTGNAMYGGLSLFALGLGMGIPLLVVAFGGRKLLPNAGNWMNSVRALFGVMLLGVSIWMLERVIPPALTLLLWGILLAGSAIFLGALRINPETSTDKIKQAAGIIVLVYGVCLIVGASMGNSNPLQPLERQNTQLNGIDNSTYAEKKIDLIKVNTVTEMNQLLTQSIRENRSAMVDFYADWCITCKVMERTVFPDPLVADSLKKMMLIKLDITENTLEHQQLMNQYNLFGPPALLFFNPQGQEVESIRTQGDISADQLKLKLDRLLSS
ncbi:hypothetical protein ACH42_06495 [Endozoicomonas sp. (ex Bugula neritina AB1)]|nr:hypothetical protein ACH42_06495 [Endozoicomonas sp. (ex Bugula neritina AB1)]